MYLLVHINDLLYKTLYFDFANNETETKRGYIVALRDLTSKGTPFQHLYEYKVHAFNFPADMH